MGIFFHEEDQAIPKEVRESIRENPEEDQRWQVNTHRNVNRSEAADFRRRDYCQQLNS